MKNKLEEINSISGVRTSFMYFNDGEIVYDSLPAGFDSDIFLEIAKDAVQMAAIFDRLSVPISEYDLKYDSGRVFIYAQHNYNLVILCESAVSAAMLRLTVNVALADLEADKKFQKRTAKIESTRRSFLIRSNMDADSWTLAEKVS